MILQTTLLQNWIAAEKNHVVVFKLKATEFFKEQSVRLPQPVCTRLKKCLKYLENDPRHASLNTHVVVGKTGDFGGKIFESYVTDKYRLTWEYGPGKKIFLRNVDNHDECLKKP